MGVESRQALVATAWRSLLILQIFSWFREQAGYPLNLSTFFLILHMLVLGHPSFQSLSWIFQGFCALILSNPFLRFSQARLLTFIFAILVSSVHIPKKGILLYWLSFPLVIYGKEPVVPWGYWKVGLFCPLGCPEWFWSFPFLVNMALLSVLRHLLPFFVNNELPTLTNGKVLENTDEQEVRI